MYGIKLQLKFVQHSLRWRNVYRIVEGEVDMTKGGKAKRQGHSVVDILFGPAPKPNNGGQRKSKKFDKSKNHHDSRKGGGGNNTGRRR